VTARKADALFPLLFAVPAAASLGQLAWPQAALYTAGSPTPFVWMAALTKLVLLGSAAAFSYRNSSGLQSGHEDVAAAWRRLALGWMMYFAGQLCLAWYQLARAVNAPYPSIADLFFLGSYPFFFAALPTFLHAYHDAGFAVDTKSAQGRLAAYVSAGCLAVAVPLLHPAAVAPTRPAETALNLAYPVLDLALVVPVALLVRVAVAFRGGAVARIWSCLLAGFAFMCAGDVLFAYFSALGRVGLDPFVHATYILSYGLVAEGARRQLELLRGLD
jgi:hypothetical protein